MKKYIPFLLTALLLASCTEVETIDRTTLGPEQQNPELYARYLRALCHYKQSAHYLTYARMDNAPEVSTSPRDYLHAMPDSLDMIALRRPLSKFDLQDLPAVQAKGTQVLAWADCTEAATAASALRAALDQITDCGLDGLVLACGSTPLDGALLSQAATLTGKTLIFEGDAALVQAASRELFDLYVLDATDIGNIFALQQQMDYTLDRLGIPASKLLVAAAPTGSMDDTALKAQAALPIVSRCVMSVPLAGLAVYDIGKDYYDPSTNYRRTKEAIALLNPAY